MTKIRIRFLLILFSLFYTASAYSDLSDPEKLAKQAEIYYQRAVKIYKELINKEKNSAEYRIKLAELYCRHANYSEIIEILENIRHPLANKYRGIAYYHLGRFSEALDNFRRIEDPDDEALYFYALNLERLNLFDEAISVYRKIKNEKISGKIKERIEELQQHSTSQNIKDISPFIYKSIIEAPKDSLFPQAGALILYCDEKIEVDLEGKQISYIHYLIKILNPRGKENFSEIHIDYDSTFERVELEYARTIKTDGEVINVSPRHIRDVSKYLDFPLYSNARVLIISFPEVSEGVYLEYKLKIYRTELINKKDLFLNYPLQAEEPIIKAKFSLQVPKNNPCHFKIINQQYQDFEAELKPQIKEDKNYLIYSWEFCNLPQIIPEPNMPPVSEVNPTILISTFDSWQEIYNWWHNLVKDRIIADNAIKKKVKQLTDGKKDLKEKIRAIYNFCAKEIRYVAVEYGQAGYQPHSAEQIFKYKYGDCKDQAVLLVTMLREIAVPAYLVLIPTKSSYRLYEDFPTLNFNHCIAMVEYNNEYIFMDPTCEVCSFGTIPISDQGRKVLVFKEDNYLITQTPLSVSSDNLIKTEFKIKFDNKDNLTAERKIYTLGIYDQNHRFWLRYTPPELIKDALKEKIQELAMGSVLEDYNIENLENLDKPVSLTYRFKEGEFFIKAGSLRIFPSLAEIDSALVAKEKRKYPLDLSFAYKKIFSFEIELPKIYSIAYLPEDVFEDSPWLECHLKYKNQTDKIIFEQIIILKKEIISVNEYVEFRNFIHKVASRIKERIVLKKIE